MYVKSGFSNYLLFVKTHYYENKQLIVHRKVDNNSLVIKNEIVCNKCIKCDINLDIAQKEHEI